MLTTAMGRFTERRRKLVEQSAFADVQIELTLLTFQNLLFTVIVSGISLIGTTGLLSYHYGDRNLLTISGLMVVTWALRLLVVLGFAQVAKSPLTVPLATRWERLYALATFLYCGTLAATIVYDFRFHDATAWILCIFGAFMFCGASAARLGTRPWVTNSSCAVILSALAYSVLCLPDVFARIGAILICSYAYAQYQAIVTKFRVLVEQLRTRRKLRELAEQDALTGLANRRFFTKSLAAMCDRKDLFAILFLDLDRFKAVNDTYGHATGDSVLQQVAARLRYTIRKEDLLARLGGDEFAILQVPVMNEESAISLASRINQAIAVPFVIDGEQISIGASVGIKLSTAQEIDPHRLLSKADDALYRVKQTDRGSFAVA